MDNDNYEVVIIGAGIGSLVCGCYLAREGVSVCIVERNSNPGGYCTSFTVKGFLFDGFVHSLGNLSENNAFGQIIDDFGIREELELVKYDPSDIITTPDYRIEFRNDINETIDGFENAFPEEKDNIREFFTDILELENLDSVSKLRRKTFHQFLSGYFSNKKLIKILSFPIFAHMGASANQISAFSAVKHFVNFMINGGSYPESGIQALPNALANKFEKWGGQLIFSKKVDQILFDSDQVKSVRLADGKIIKADIIISNCDARQTFLELIGKDKLSDDFINKLQEMKLTAPLFIIFLGLKTSNVIDELKNGADNTYLLNYDYDMDHECEINYDANPGFLNWFLIKPNYKLRTMQVFATAPFKSHEYWKENRKKVMDLILENIFKKFPDLKGHIEFKICSSPSTFNKWTLNDQGASYGWAMTPDQFMDFDFARNNIIDNLYLCGHWTTIASGVPGVSIGGSRLARVILFRLGKATSVS